MDKATAKRRGSQAGYAAASVTMEDLNRGDYPDAESYKDAVVTESFEAELHARQYHPFEVLAHEINSCEEKSDELWEAYDDGVARGIERCYENCSA